MFLSIQKSFHNKFCGRITLLYIFTLDFCEEEKRGERISTWMWMRILGCRQLLRTPILVTINFLPCEKTYNGWINYNGLWCNYFQIELKPIENAHLFMLFKSYFVILYTSFVSGFKSSRKGVASRGRSLRWLPWKYLFVRLVAFWSCGLAHVLRRATREEAIFKEDQRYLTYGKRQPSIKSFILNDCSGSY